MTSYSKLFLLFTLSVLTLPAQSQDSTDIKLLAEKVKAIDRDTSLKLVNVARKKGYQLIARLDTSGYIVYTDEFVQKGDRVSSTRCYFDYIYPYCIKKSAHTNAVNKSSIPEETTWYLEYNEIIAKQGFRSHSRDKNEQDDLLTLAATQYRKTKKAQLKDPFECFTFDRVMAYPLIDDRYHDGESGNKQVMSAIITERGKTVTREQLNTIKKLVRDTASFQNAAASCFNPRMAFVFYLENNVVGTMPVCLECNRVETTGLLHIPAISFNPSVHPKTGCTSCEGLSPAARKKLNEICRALELNGCLDHYDSPFDEPLPGK